MFAPDASAQGEGPAVLFEFDCLHPTEFTFRFTPELRWMWPERNEGVPGAEWVSHPGEAGGFYVLHADYRTWRGRLRFRGRSRGFWRRIRSGRRCILWSCDCMWTGARSWQAVPVADGGGDKPCGGGNASAGRDTFADESRDCRELCGACEGYKNLLAKSTTIETPNKALDEAFQWATVSIEQLRAKVQGTDETALVAGYYASGDSARPGFGWFFGRDSLYTLYAVNGYGDFALAKMSSTS